MPSMHRSRNGIEWEGVTGVVTGDIYLEVGGGSKSSQGAVEKLGFGGTANVLSADGEGL